MHSVNKRLICAIWGAMFAVLAVIPYLLIANRDYWVVPVGAFAGFVVGFFVQAEFIRIPGGLARAAFGGGLSAILAFPILCIFAALNVGYPPAFSLHPLADPQFPIVILRAWFVAILFAGWLVVPIGAIGGLLLQIVLRRLNKSAANL